MERNLYEKDDTAAVAAFVIVGAADGLRQVNTLLTSFCTSNPQIRVAYRKAIEAADGEGLHILRTSEWRRLKSRSRRITLEEEASQGGFFNEE